MVVTIGITLLALLMAGLIAWRSSKGWAIGVVVVMAVQFGLAWLGVLRDQNIKPPPIMAMMAFTMLYTLMLAFSSTGRSMAANHSFAMLIGSQAFRFPLELVMHRAASDGLMPAQMSYSGCNFDILTGITAIPVAWLASKGQAPRWLLIAWNALGSFLLLAIMAIAISSMPFIQAFGPDHVNTWVFDPPYVWLPGVLVPAALLGHILIWRKISIQSV